jgi:hypothetical protein
VAPASTGVASRQTHNATSTPGLLEVGPQDIEVGDVEGNRPIEPTPLRDVIVLFLCDLAGGFGCS